jgi:hypothetical protein
LRAASGEVSAEPQLPSFVPRSTLSGQKDAAFTAPGPGAAGRAPTLFERMRGFAFARGQGGDQPEPRPAPMPPADKVSRPEFDEARDLPFFLKRERVDS